MTNEQTRLLLNMIANQIEDLAEKIEPLIVDGKRESQYRWVGVGEEPGISFVYDPSDWILLENPTGQFLAVITIIDFAEEIRQYAEELK